MRVPIEPGGPTAGDWEVKQSSDAGETYVAASLVEDHQYPGYLLILIARPITPDGTS